MTQSLMHAEIREIPDAVARLLDQGGPAIRAAADAARDRDPAFIATVARGSSDHAATYLKYLAELALGLPVASIGPSVASIYGAKLRLGGALTVSVSQSGRSPDIVELTRAARAGGALTLAVTNDPSSPLAQVSDQTLALHAGPERSVAATKTFVTSAVACLSLIAEWSRDAALIRAIAGAARGLRPRRRRRLVAAGGSAETGSETLYTIGRGPAWAMSNEAALKFKETCLIHAESYSSAEVLHGPVSIVSPGFPVLAFAAADAAEASLAEAADGLAAKGAHVFATTPLVRAATQLPVIRTGHPLADPLALIVSFYAMVEQLAVARGIDPDTPRHLNKVTQTT